MSHERVIIIPQKPRVRRIRITMDLCDLQIQVWETDVNGNRCTKITVIPKTPEQLGGGNCQLDHFDPYGMEITIRRNVSPEAR
mgnify:FL=1